VCVLSTSVRQAVEIGLDGSGFETQLGGNFPRRFRPVPSFLYEGYSFFLGGKVAEALAQYRVGLRDHGNEPWSSIKGQKFLEQISDSTSQGFCSM
jgi:hypothetical protein